MLARILPILALLVLCVLGYWLYSQGTLTQVLRPTVVAVETKRQLVQGQRIRESFITAREVSIVLVEPGMVTFPSGTTEREIEQALSGVSVSRNVERGALLRSTMVGRSATFAIIRATSDIFEGQTLSVENVAASSLDTAPPTGAIVFESEEEAALYLTRTFDISARADIPAGRVLTISDISGGSNPIFVVRTARSFSRAERLAISGLEVTEVIPRDLTSGAITFLTRGAADIFIASAGRYVLSRSAQAGDIVTADMIANDAAEDQAMAAGDVPRTLSEVISYMRAYPDRAMMLDNTTFAGLGALEPNGVVDIWVEESRTGGAFGQINIKRVAAGLLVREAEDTEQPASEDAGVTQSARVTQAAMAQPAIGAQTEAVLPPDTEPEKRRYFWIETPIAAKQGFDAAKEQGRIAFAITSGEPIVSMLGNGATCLADRCQVNRAASSDLGHVVEAMQPRDGAGNESPVEMLDPLTVMDGVGPALEARLRDNGYDSFEKIAAWTDGEIPAITIKLDISNNLAIYIRLQAAILTAAAEDAARELGFEQAPQE